MAEVKVTQTKSVIGGTAGQRSTMRTLGLKRIGDSVTKTDSPQVQGMIRTVAHLVTVEEV
jgi:large subunit ribosomal protein L30